VTARSVNARFRSLPCAGACGATVRCHPAVKLVVCARCVKTLASVWSKLADKKAKKAS
jgi:hypothetical protein